MSATCNWCPLLPRTARSIVLEAARQGRPHGLGPQCSFCRQTDWSMKTLSLQIRQIEEERERRMAS